MESNIRKSLERRNKQHLDNLIANGSRADKSVMKEYWEETNNYHKPINEIIMPQISKHDLRIGNMFEQGIVWKISGRSGAKVHLHGKGKWYKGFRSEVDVDKLTPIPLTPKVLVEWCGFKDNGDGIFDSKNMTVGWNGEEWREDWAGVKLNGLHELQNLYYVLNKSELEIKG